MKSKKKHRKPGSTQQSSLTVLDVFTPRDLDAWEGQASAVQIYNDRVYFDLERQRIARQDELCGALRSVPAIEVALGDWVRVTDWLWNLTPLLPEGSLRGIGGRFNIGRDLDRAKGQEFPCLYVAQDFETGLCEHFGGPLGSLVGELTLGEFALRTKSSFTTFVLRGKVEQVFDLRDHAGLTEFVKIISRFEMSNDTKRYPHRYGLRPRELVRSPKKLWKLALTSPTIWRAECQTCSIPSPGQILGRFIRDAGFEGVLYPSQQGGRLCLALFPENFKASNSRIEVVGDIPPGAKCTVLDRHHLCLKSDS